MELAVNILKYILIHILLFLYSLFKNFMANFYKI